MAKIACDICGGSLSMDPSGEFAVCDLCGMKHTKDRIKAMAQVVTGTVAVSNIASVESLMKRGYLALEDSKWGQADEYFDKVLDINAECAPAYIGKLCAELKFGREELLLNDKKLLTEYSNYQKAYRFADANYRAKLDGYNKVLQEYIANLAKIRKKIAIYKNYISCSYHTVGLKSDGTVVTSNARTRLTSGGRIYGADCTESWRDIVAVAAGPDCTYGLKSDGTVVVATASWDKINKQSTESWRDIVAISCGYKFTIGLKSDGKVVAVGDNNYGRCNTESWQDIVAISCGDSYTVGLKSDGTVVAVGTGRCTWRDIVAISCGYKFTIGLKSDGTVVAVGGNNYGQCNTESWQDIVAISCGAGHTVGLKSDGTVVAVGNNEYGGCNTDSWHGIVAIAAGDDYTVGLKSNGTVVGRNKTDGWHGIGPISEEMRIESKRRDEQERAEQQRRLEQQRAEQQLRLEQERAEQQRRLEQQRRWISQGLCRHCGGQIGGLFTKKCKSCGKAN